MTEKPIHIGFPVFPNVMPLDFVGPWEVLSRVPGAKCHMPAIDRKPIALGQGFTIQPGITFEDCPQLDILCVPGGYGVLAMMENEAFLDFLRRQAETASYVTSVCTGSLALAAAGLLRGYRATTHWMSMDRLSAFGVIPVDERVVVDRNRITGGGITAGLDFGLTLASILAGEDIARQIQLQLEYTPSPPFADADPSNIALAAKVRESMAPYIAKMRETDSRILNTMER